MPADPMSLAKRQESLRLTNQITNRQLATVLRESAQEAARSAQTVASATRRAQLTMASDDMFRISRNLWNKTGEITRQGIREQAMLAARHGVDLDALVGMPVNRIPGYTRGMIFNAQQAAESVIARRQFGHTLSERILRNGRRGATAATRVVETGLAQGLSAKELATRVRDFYSPSVPGGQSHAAMRLARTEINNSYLTVQKEHAAEKPWNEWMKWELSASHPREDDCDDLADGGDNPSEPGLYRPENLPQRPHPNCLCYGTTVTVSPEQFEKDLLNGVYDDWLTDHGLAPVGEVA